jgi:leucyl aminopeptidase
MNIKHLTSDPLQADVDLLGMLCHDDTLDSDPLVSRADAALSGLLRSAITDERFVAKPGQTVTLHSRGDVRPRRLSLIGAGPTSGASVASTRVAAGRLARTAAAVGARSVALALPASPENLSPSAQLQAATEGFLLGLYRFDRYLDPSKRTTPSVQSLALASPAALADDAAAAALTRAQELARAIGQARNLVNEPAGYLTPQRLADIAQQIARETGLELTVLDRAACRERGMGLFLAVAQGSVEEPRFIHLAWKPERAQKKVVLIGKGVTFDSGGLSLKTNDGMLDMKTDMSGAAAVISAVESAARQKLPIEIHALAACTENMPSGTAYKLGDVIRSMAGKTVEITNTDAEGRLTLADAITYGLELKPDFIFDFATLTGACVVALGPHIAGVMSNNDALVATWLAAAKDAGEEMWHLPLPPRLLDQLKSEIADLKNTGERWGGALTAGLFLKEFVDATPWVHVDLAGPASTDKELGHVSKGGTGFGVATILQFLYNLPSTK